MNIILQKLIKNEQITDDDIAEELYDICCAVHASCDSECPIFALENKIPMNENKECYYFKSGHKMLKKLRQNNQSSRGGRV